MLVTAFAGYAGGAIGSSRRFRVFDALGHEGKPNLSHQGLERIVMFDHIWRPGESHDEVDERGVIDALAHISSQQKIIFVDIENWPLIKVSAATRSDNIRKFVRVATIIRRECPELQLGFYGTLPVDAYWPIVARDESYHEWLQANRALEIMAPLVDYVFPSLYTFYDDRSGWLTVANGQLEAAQRYGKPVLPFLWFEYHDSNPDLRDHEVKAEAWEEELRFCRAHADGVVLWGGDKRRWSESARWWQIAMRVLDIPPARSI